MTTLALANQKGGVAKTTSVVSLGAALSELGLSVLLVDLDPQASMTFSLGVDPEDLDVTIHDVMVGNATAVQALVGTEDGPDLLPAGIELARVETEFAGVVGREKLVRTILETLTAQDIIYDWVILDCPPTLGVLTVAALTAADAVIIPLQCETLAHRGVGQLLDTLHDVRQHTNADLETWGVLPTMYDGRTTHARTVLENIADTYDLEVISPPIPKTIKFAEAPAAGRSILSTARTNKGAQAYREVAAGLVARERSARPRRRKKKS